MFLSDDDEGAGKRGVPRWGVTVCMVRSEVSEVDQTKLKQSNRHA